jgi:hypothetical protein
MGKEVIMKIDEGKRKYSPYAEAELSTRIRLPPSHPYLYPYP